MRTGTLYAFVSSALTGSFQVISKLLLQQANQATVMTIWFMLGSIFQPLIGIAIHKQRFFSLVRENLRSGLLLGFANLFTAGFFFTSVNIIGPGATVFFAKLDIIFILLLGYFFMKESLTKRELAGVAVAILGSLIFASSSATLGVLSLLGVGAAFMNAIHTLLARHFTQSVPITVLQTFRAVVTFGVLLPFALFSNQLTQPSSEFLLLATLGVLLGPVAGIALFYASVKELRASIVSLIRNLEPFIVTIYIYFIFDTVPTIIELIGGAVIVLGVTITLLKDTHYDLIFARLRRATFK